MRTKQQESWYRWWLKNKAKHLVSVRKHRNNARIRIRTWLNEYKNARGCGRCPFNAHPAALDFHHKGNKKFTIGDIAGKGYSLALVKKEIEKCELICANCHRIETHSKKITGG